MISHKMLVYNSDCLNMENYFHAEKRRKLEDYTFFLCEEDYHDYQLIM